MVRSITIHYIIWRLHLTNHFVKVDQVYKWLRVNVVIKNSITFTYKILFKQKQAPKTGGSFHSYSIFIKTYL